MKLTKLLAVSAALLLLAGPAEAQKRKKIKFETYELKSNGLKVILHRDETAPVVAVTVSYHVGSKNEDPTRTGFAHFFEHLLFEGSENIKRGEFDKHVTKAGGALNANTSQDRTFYYELLPSNELALGLWLESERMMHAKILTEGVETQREVVKEEKRQRIDNQPYATFTTEMFKRLFVAHPYKWMPIGSMEHLNAAKLEEFVDFYKTYYVPNNAVLSIAGNIDIKETKKLIEKYFAGIPRGTKEIKRPNITEPAMTKEIRDTIYDNIQLPAVFQGYHIPKQGEKDYYAFNILSQILSGGPSSRLNKEVKDKQETALEIASFPFALEDAGVFITLGIVNMGVKIEDLEKSMDAEIEKLQNELVSEREFKKVLNQIETDFISGNATMAGIAESLSDYMVYFGDANLINTELDRYKKVTREDLQRVAKKYLVKSNRVVLHYLPRPAKS